MNMISFRTFSTHGFHPDLKTLFMLQVSGLLQVINAHHCDLQYTQKCYSFLSRKRDLHWYIFIYSVILHILYAAAVNHQSVLNWKVKLLIIWLVLRLIYDIAQDKSFRSSTLHLKSFKVDSKFLSVALCMLQISKE